MWVPMELRNLVQGVQALDTVQNQTLGDMVKAFDPIHGVGEFIYLQGVAACLAGSLVTYNWSATAALNYQAVLDPATANNSLPKAFAMAPCVAANFGWFQIAGAAFAVNNATAAVGNAFAKAGGQVGSAAVAGTQVLGAQIAVANGSTFTAVVTTRSGSTFATINKLDGIYVGLPISGAGIPGGATITAGQLGEPFNRNNIIILSAAATADATVTATFTRTNFSIVMCERPTGQGQIT